MAERRVLLPTRRRSLTDFLSFTYDTCGRRTSSIDQNGQTTSYTYDDGDSACRECAWPVISQAQN